ncbi:MAG: MotA/TolQ/ExbB proton channel family protein, partial [Planctomycetota bacterium]
SRAICERHPSAAADVVLAMLAKVGRPHPEVEAAASEEIDRQADRLYANVRTLNLAAAVAPLMGLLGTVWGMIEAFFVTASLPIEANKGQALAQGIYTALFTTFAGLAVAIPAAVLAHLFEGRILRLMRRIEQLVAELLPCLERFEGERRHLLTTGAAGVGGVGLPDDGLTNDGLPDDGFATRSDPAWAAVPGNHSTPAVSPTPPAPQS